MVYLGGVAADARWGTARVFFTRFASKFAGKGVDIVHDGNVAPDIYND